MIYKIIAGALSTIYELNLFYMQRLASVQGKKYCQIESYLNRLITFFYNINFYNILVMHNKIYKGSK